MPSFRRLMFLILIFKSMYQINHALLLLSLMIECSAKIRLPLRSLYMRYFFQLLVVQSKSHEDTKVERAAG
ncbi:hypothetical protein EUGRSUZ_J00749 [Eucalyptus grandis]|uniref:Uncharacterized protein n=2 Tax=Eucalyptus grandis TaxID=71139 RepID=A0A059AAN6_EUCGR|nr:hypothetical protein EUGRSUZ_J00749 [Eucalyptus grandis]